MTHDKELVAPCGINCRYCEAYLLRLRGMTRNRYQGCAGCRARNKQCAFIKKRCEKIRDQEIDFCYECEVFPCENLVKIEERYQKRGWDCSFIGNNEHIRETGLDAFVKEQKKHYTCKKCGGDICIHTGKCYDCGK